MIEECCNGEDCMSVHLDVEQDMQFGDVCVECMKFDCSRCECSIDVDEEICIGYDVFVCADCFTADDVACDMNGTPLESVVL